MATINATQLRPGMRVEDDYTAFAQVVTATRTTDRGGDPVVRVVWKLADDRIERTEYSPTDLFTSLA